MLVVEAKTASWRMAKEWEGGSIPQEYFAQVQGYLWATQHERCDVVALIGGADLRIVTVKPDVELLERG